MITVDNTKSGITATIKHNRKLCDYGIRSPAAQPVASQQSRISLDTENEQLLRFNRVGQDFLADKRYTPWFTGSAAY